MTKALIRGAQSVVLTQARPASQHPAAVYLAGLSKGSRPTMRTSLETIAMLLTGHADAGAVDWGALRFQHTAAVRAELMDRYAAATANRVLAALRGVLKTAWRLGQMSAEDYQRARDVSNVAGSTLPAGRALSAGEIAALLDACAADPTPAGARDSALIALLRVGGLRRAEICALGFDDYDPATGQLVVRGKRNKERTAYVQGGAAEALTDWLAERVRQAPAVGPLFCPVNRGGHVVVRQMHPEAIYNALMKRARQAGVRKLSPHDLRRTFVSDLLDAGADLSTVQRLAGHASVNTTVRYDRRGEEAKRKAVELLHVPYKRRKAAQ
jgi:site-specific recombinase XerD